MLLKRSVLRWIRCRQTADIPVTFTHNLQAGTKRLATMRRVDRSRFLTVTTMPGDDVTHPVPDNTGYITEGQFYLHGERIDPFGSLSRLKQLVIGKVTREDHGELANCMIRLYAESKKARERQSMGFRGSR